VSLQEDIKNVKQELSTEESFLESFLKLEKFYKKYKSTIIGLVIIIIVGIIGFYGYDYMQTQKQIEINTTFNKVLKDPNDKKALESLKIQDKALYKIALMMQDRTQKTDNKFLNQLATYTQAIQTDNILELSTTTQEQDFLLKDFALLNKAILEAKEGKYSDAKSSISLIPKDSNIQSLAKMLEHFLMTK
jgi:hypothetical protein